MGDLNFATGKWRSDAERMRHNRERRKQTDPDFLARERARIAAIRGGATPPLAPPAPPPAPEDSAPDERAAAVPVLGPPCGGSPLVAALQAKWDEAEARRVGEREARRAARRRTG